MAADAGAAAGVVWIPDPTAYSNNALEAVRRNGFPTASLVTSFAAAEAMPVPPPLPWVEVVLTTNSTLEVAVRTEADTFFTSPILDSVTVTRRAEAQYIEPTPLGNPTSALGTGGDTEYPGTPDNFYLQTRTDTRRNGDIIGPATGVFGTPNPLFTSLAARPELQGAYFYEIEVPAGIGGQYQLELRVVVPKLRRGTSGGTLNWSVYAPGRHRWPTSPTTWRPVPSPAGLGPGRRQHLHRRRPGRRIRHIDHRSDRERRHHPRAVHRHRPVGAVADPQRRRQVHPASSRHWR